MTVGNTNINELLWLIDIAKSSQFADTEVAHMMADLSWEQCIVLDRHELGTLAIPQMERAQEKMRKAQSNHDLREIERARWSIEVAQEHIERVNARIEKELIWQREEENERMG